MYKALTTAAFVGLACTASSNAALVNPTNNDFQTDNVSGFSSGAITGWAKTGGSGVVDGDNDVSYPGTTAEQWGVMFGGGGSLASSVGTVDAGSTTYELSFLTGQNSNSALSFSGTAVVTIEVAGTVVATYDAAPTIPAQDTGPFADSFEFTLDTADVDVDAGDAVLVRFASTLTSGQWIIDDVTVGVVPEPSSLALLGLGGLMAMRRRRA